MHRNTAVSCPVTSVLAAGTPPGFGLCAAVGTAASTSPINMGSPRWKQCAMPWLRQGRGLFVMRSSFLVVRHTHLWLCAGSKVNATPARVRRVLCINYMHLACVMWTRGSLTPCPAYDRVSETGHMLQGRTCAVWHRVGAVGHLDSTPRGSLQPMGDDSGDAAQAERRRNMAVAYDPAKH